MLSIKKRRTMYRLIYSRQVRAFELNRHAKRRTWLITRKSIKDYRCAYHVVWCPKYRRPVIEGAVDARLKQIIRDVCAERECNIIELETMPDPLEIVKQYVANQRNA